MITIRQKKENKLNIYKQYLLNAERRTAEKLANAGNNVSELTEHGGQPILTNHHSEAKHRAMIKNTDNAFRKVIEEEQKIKYWKDKIEALKTELKNSSFTDEVSIESLNEDIENIKKQKEELKQNKNKMTLQNYNFELYNLNHQIKLKQSRIKTQEYLKRKNNN